MKNACLRTICKLVFGALVVFASAAVHAQTFPSKPLRIIVPAEAGGPIDILSRVIGKVITEQAAAPVVIENKAGAAGSIGVTAAARAQPDGHTLVIAGLDAIAVYPLVKKNPPYRVERDLTPIAMIASTSLVFAVDARSPAGTMKEFAALAKSGKLSYASSGSGGAIQLAIEMFKQKAGIELLHVPYKGGGPALLSTASGQTDLTAASPMGAKKLLQGGQLKALAISGKARSPLLPEVPTMAESGYPELTIPIWFGVFAPAGLSRAVSDRLSAIFLAAVGSPEFRKQAENLGLEVETTTGAAYARVLQAESRRWQQVIETSGIRLDE